jgi:hypothetical protein
MSATDVKVASELARVKQVLNEAIASKHSLVQQALDEERRLRERIAIEAAALLAAQESHIKGKGAELVAANVKKDVSEKLKTDAALLQTLTKAAAGNAKSPLPLTVNKMHLAIAGAEQLIADGHFETVFSGSNIDGYSFQYQPAAITIIGDNTTRFGTAKGIFHDTLAFTTHLVSTGKTNLSDINLLSTEVGPWHRRSALVYDAPIPSEIDLTKLDARFPQFTYAYQGKFGYIHGNYAWGGGRDGNTTNPWAPLDCSAWVAKLTGSSIIYSTADQLCFDRVYKTRLGLALTHPVAAELAEPVQLFNQNWSKAPELPVMDSLYEPVVIRDPQKDIQPGQIYFHRRFNDTHPKEVMRVLGIGGHTGLTLGFISDAENSRVVVLSYNRDIEGAKKIVGFGVEEFPLFTKPDASAPNMRKEVYFTNMAKKDTSAPNARKEVYFTDMAKKAATAALEVISKAAGEAAKPSDTVAAAAAVAKPEAAPPAETAAKIAVKK